ncbi:MAG: hypothetical protein KatS3mg077_3156 [Candidatus Binatia bacterium]|nr:MAG: hypothetical protein KatS3mg077_3156 [Candidatus Binatia bacterium]
MKSRAIVTVSLLGAMVWNGCATHRSFNKPWGKGAWIPAAICGVAGAGAGVGIQEARRGESTAVVFDSQGNVVSSKRVKDDAEYWKGALIGAAVGAAVCGLLGHYFLDEEIVPPPPPPPPPPTPSPETLPPPWARRLVLRGVNFDFNKSDIRPDSRPVLDEAAEILKANPEVRISIEGHTDAIGSDAYNEKLSVRRAEAVFRYLVNRGVAPERMEVIGYGESRPVADNTTEEGRAQNRRVELHIISPVAPELMPPAETAPPEPPAGRGETTEGGGSAPPAAEAPAPSPPESEGGSPTP